MHKPFDLEERMSLNMPSDDEIELLVESCCQKDMITEGSMATLQDVTSIMCGCSWCTAGPSAC